MIDVEIRYALEDESEQLAKVHLASYLAAYQDLMPQEYLAKLTLDKRIEAYRRILIEDTNQVTTLRVNRQTIGCMVFGICRDQDLAERSGEIESLYLLPNFQGNGYGKMLLHWGLEKLLEQGCEACVLWVLRDNYQARGFYERLGFTLDGSERTIIRGTPIVQVRYMLELG